MSMVMKLVKKDFHFMRMSLLAYLLGTLVIGSLLLKFADNGRLMTGLVSFAGLSLFGLYILFANVVMERTTKTLPYVMSLPISQREYTVSKIISSFALYIPVWLIFSASIIFMISQGNNLPNNAVNLITIMLLELLVSFTIVFSAALIKESFGWVIGATIFCVMLVSFSTFLFDIIVGLIPSNLRSNSLNWTPEQIMAVSIEILFIAGILWFTYIWQIRKTDFVK